MVYNVSKRKLFLFFGFLCTGLVLILMAKGPEVSRKSLISAWAVIEQGLRYKDSVVREEAVKALGLINSTQSDRELAAALNDESEYVRIWAAKILAKRGNYSGKMTLLRILSNTAQPPKTEQTGPLATLAKMKALAKGRIRGEAAKALAYFDDPELISILKEAKKDDDGRVRDGAAVALALKGDRSEVIVFSSAIDDPDQGIRLAAVEALGAVGDPKSVSPLIQALNDNDESVRAAAAKALGQIKSSEAADALAEYLRDQSGMVRENSAWSLGEIGAQEKIPNLKASLQDPNGMVQLAAAEALGKMDNDTGLPTVESALASNEMDARTRGALVLGHIKTMPSQNLAIKTLEDGNIKTRLGAAVSLFKMVNRKDAE